MGLGERFTDWVFSIICSLSPLPYITDQEVMALMAGYDIFPMDMFPGIEPKTFDDYSLLQKIACAAPFLDKEVSKALTFGFIDVFAMLGGDSDDEPSLDRDLSDPTNPGNRSSRGRGNSYPRNGRPPVHKQRIEKHKETVKGAKRSAAGGAIKIFEILVVLLLIGGLGILGVNAATGGSSNLGSYIPYFGEKASSQAAGVSTELSGAARTYQKAKARVFCLLKGPACLRQWRMNNTQRPGSTEVGQTYGLKVDNFQAGQGTQIDTAFKEADYAFPVSFSVSNPRHGLKGIDALNVSYRIRMVEGANQLDDPNCDTDWIAIHNGYDIGDGSELDPGGSGYTTGVKDDIFPGTSASTNFVRIDEDFIDEHGYNDSGDPLTLESCGMLQPALGDSLTAIVDVKYNYFSQATLYFQAMSRSNLEANSDIQIENKKSETADTPVKAAVNVNSPVVYSSTGSGRTSQAFKIRSTLNTDKNDVRYKVRDLYVENSGLTEEIDSAVCDFANKNDNTVGPGDNMYLLANANEIFRPGSGVDVTPNSPAANMIAGSDKNRPDSYYWFDTARTAPMYGCTMELSNPNEIDAAGETLTVGVKSNYTVAKQDRLGSLSVQNNACTRHDCPLIVTLSRDRAIGSYDFKNKCEGIDAGNGCSIIEFQSLYGSGSDSWATVQGHRFMANEGIESIGNPTDNVIDSGEVAIDLGDQNGVSGYHGRGFAGLSASIWEILDPDMDGLNIKKPDQNYTMVQYQDEDGRWEVEFESECIPPGSNSTTEEVENFRVLKTYGAGCGSATASP